MHSISKGRGDAGSLALKTNRFHWGFRTLHDLKKRKPSLQAAIL
jgi:hypothetical protein